MKLLIAENDRQIVELIRLAIAQRAEVIATSTLAKTLEIVKDVPDLDALIFDVALDDCSSINSINVLRSLRPDLPIVVMTGTVIGCGSEDQVILRGADGYVPKPVALSKLLDVLCEAVAKYRSNADLAPLKETVAMLKKAMDVKPDDKPVAEET